jgi:nitrogen fixation protein NifU and related proteins
MTMDYYREYILDHYRNPRNYGKLEQPTVHADDSNPLCGDQLGIDLLIEDERVAEVRFKGRGCAISQAAASMLSEMIEGRPLEEVTRLGKDDILEALGISISPARTKCAFLSLRVLHRSLALGGFEKPPAGAEDEDEDEV